MPHLSLQQQTFLNNIQVVLVNTTLPANIGSAARAMKTMGLSQLTVVKPKHLINDDAIAHAAGATDVLDNINIVDTLPDALAHSTLVFATSSRQRSMPWPLFDTKTASTMAWKHWQSQSAQINLVQTKSTQSNQENHQSCPTDNHTISNISIVFGREDRGLTNDELALANHHLTIPANPSYGVLNLAAAVQVVCYELFCVSEQTTDQNSLELQHTLRVDWDEPAASHEQLQQIEQHYLDLLTRLDLYDKDNPRNTKKRVQRLLARTQLDTKEYNLLRATLARLADFKVQSPK